MVKKLKAMAQSASNDHELAAAVKESAQHIWLAGLGAFAKAQEEGQKLFGALMKEGKTLQKRTLGATGDKVGEVSGQVRDQVSGLAEQLQKQAADTWDKLETVFEQRVERALDRLGMPSRKEIAELTEKVEQLTAAVSQLPANNAQKRSAPKKAVKKSAKKATAAKASSKKR